MKRPSHVSLVFLSLLVGLFTLPSCGKKGAPTLKAFDKPEAVTAISALQSEEKVVLSWEYPDGLRKKIEGFIIEQHEAVPGGTEQGAAGQIVLKADATSHVTDSLVQGRHYSFTIRPVSLKKVQGDLSPPLDVVPAKPPPPPAGLTFRLLDDGVEISWEKVPGDVKYRIYRSSEADSSPAPVAILSDPLFRDSVETARTVSYSVRTVLDNALKTEGHPSAELTVHPADYVPAAPAGLRFAASDDRVHLSWTENRESWVTGYRVYRRSAEEREFAPIGESLSPVFTDRFPLAAEAFYAVTALGPAREGPLSVQVGARPAKE